MGFWCKTATGLTRLRPFTEASIDRNHCARVAAGKLEMLVKLGITLAQAEVLGNLTNKAVNRLAFGWNGPIIFFTSDAFIRGTALHVHAAKQHATAFVATLLKTEKREHS